MTYVICSNMHIYRHILYSQLDFKALESSDPSHIIYRMLPSLCLGHNLKKMCTRSGVGKD